MKGKWGILLFAVVGIALVVFGIAAACVGAWKNKNYDRATGVITDVDKYVDGDMIARYTRTYTYQVDGVDYEITESSSDNKPKLGAEKDIVYDPADPESAEIVQNTSENVILVIMGIISLAIAVNIKKRTDKKAVL